jgi:sugar lactone lactonase YvrE
LYVASGNNNQILRYDGRTGAFLGVFASGGGLSDPFGIAFGPDGNLYVCSVLNSKILRYNGKTGAFIDSTLTFFSPRGLTFGPNGVLYAVGGGLYSAAPGGPLGLLNPSVGGNDVVFGPDGNLYVTSQSVVLRCTANGSFLGQFASTGSNSYATDLAFGPDGNLYVSVEEPGYDCVERFNGQTGAFIDNFVSSGSGGLVNPWGLAFFTPVPEPSTVALWGAAASFLLVKHWRSRKRSRISDF